MSKCRTQSCRVFKPDKFIVFKLESYKLMDLCRIHSFIGQSTGILGHENINNRS